MTPSATASRSGTVGSIPSDTAAVRALRMPAVWLAALVGVSTVLRAALTLRVPGPWILPDELLYSELAKSIADGSRPAIRGVAVFGWGEVYPSLIAPAWMLFDDPVWAYHAALVINALVMSLVAVPAYLLARLFVAPRLSFVVAAMAVLVPSMTYTGVLMTENAFYPAFVLAVLLVARAVRRPTLGAQALALLGLGILAFTRLQGLALVGAYAGAVRRVRRDGAASGARSAISDGSSRRPGWRSPWVSRRRRSPRRAATARWAGSARARAPSTWSIRARSRSGSPTSWRISCSTSPSCRSSRWPWSSVWGCSAGRPTGQRLFASVALPTAVAMLGSVSLVSSTFDVDGGESINERYVFVLVPLLFVGLALWIESGLPRPRPWAWATLAVACVLPVIVPIARFEYTAEFQSLALLPWQSIPATGLALAALRCRLHRRLRPRLGDPPARELGARLDARGARRWSSSARSPPSRTPSARRTPRRPSAWDARPGSTTPSPPAHGSPSCGTSAARAGSRSIPSTRGSW